MRKNKLKYGLLIAVSLLLISNSAFSETIQEGIDLYNASQYDKAIELLNKIIKAEPKNPEPHLWLSKCYEATFDLEKSLSENKIYMVLKYAEEPGNNQSKIISVKDGEFIFKQTSLEKYSSSLILKGNLLNKTNKNWQQVNFSINIKNKEGKLLEYKPIFSGTAISLKKGLEAEILFSGEIDANKDDIDYEIIFYSGEYLANYSFTMIKPKPNKLLNFEDKNIKMLFSLSTGDINFSLNNKTDDPIEINWNKVSFIDVNSKSQRVIHSGIKLIDKEKEQTNTFVPPTASIDDVIQPVNYITFDNSYTTNSLFPKEYSKSLAYKNKNFSVYMPLKIGDKTFNYFFSFKIDNRPLA